jgi:hypothetical protein
VNPEAERLVVEAFASVAVPVAIMLETVKPEAERILVEAVLAKRRVAVAFAKKDEVAYRLEVDAFTA